ncbi:MAG: N-(5'-phosphoribosyl)anthranilate isomerase [Planctomycetes bacterium ADurb.Bin401]|nr:MAG: N-(5'-phosphoribosyl)anthranilate isomerase [Planctomycetes bacterium ADurb.Bin401]
MMIPKVKICGITNSDDAMSAVQLGADLLGFNFYPKSPRYIEPKKAEQIIRKLPAYVDVVGLFINEDTDFIRKTATQLMLNWVQLHGDESPGFCASLDNMSAKVIKAIRIKDGKDIEYARNFATDALLLDAYHPAFYGGTGERFNWKLLPQLTGHKFGRTFLAGGITSENVSEAISQGFYGIDICSGIESNPGKKDHKRMAELFGKIKSVITGKGAQ